MTVAMARSSHISLSIRPVFAEMDNSNDKARSPSSFLRGLEGPRVMKATTTDGGGEGKRSPYLFNSSPRPYKPPR